MNIIDFHVHTFPEKIASHALEILSSKSHTKYFTEGTLESLIKSMSNAEISASVLQPVATKPEQVSKINDSAISINNTGKIFSFGAIHPDCNNKFIREEFARLSSSGVKGVKIHPVYQGVNIDDERFINILKFAGEFNLFVMIHSGFDIGFPDDDKALPERIAKSLDSAGNNCRVILAHMGGWRCWEDSIKFFADNENIYIDTAFSLGEFIPNNDKFYTSQDQCKMLNSQEFTRIIKIFGANRVLFGTDSPWSSQIQCVKDFDSLDLNESEKKLIFHDNAAKILRLE